MYVDGNLVAGSTNDETLPGSAGGNPAQVYGGWWHLGWSNAGQGWPDSPTNSFFTGSLSDVTIYPKVVTLANITTLYAQTSETNFITAADLLTPNSFWSMQDTGTNLYTGSIGASNPTFLDESNNPGTNTGNGIGTFSLDPNGVLGSPATLFNGTSYIQTSTGPPTAFYSSPGPQTFSIAAWFKTTTSGSIIGFSNSQTDTGQSSWDRQLWIDPTGHLVFGLYPNGIYELKSPNTYNDGNWHYVVVTVEPVNATNATVQMYVDGNLVAGSTNDETLPGSAGGNPAQVYGGWWHLGWSNAGQGWPDSPTNSFFTGSLSDITIFSSVLSTANDSQLYAQTSQVNYLNAVRGTVASSNSFWPLTAVVNSNIPCNYIGLTISGSSSCIYPNYSGSCPSTPIAAGLFINEPIPTTLGSLVFTTGLVTNPPPTCLNLHVSVGFQIETQNGGFYATLNHLYGYVLL